MHIQRSCRVISVKRLDSLWMVFLADASVQRIQQTPSLNPQWCQLRSGRFAYLRKIYDNPMVKYMIENNIHINSEILSMYDQIMVLAYLPAPVTTTAGRGAQVNLISGKVIDMPDEKGFVTFMPFQTH